MSAFKAANDMCASIRDEDGQVKAAAFLKTCELAIPIVGMLSKQESARECPRRVLTA